MMSLFMKAGLTIYANRDCRFIGGESAKPLSSQGAPILMGLDVLKLIRRNYVGEGVGTGRSVEVPDFLESALRRPQVEKETSRNNEARNNL